MKKNILPLFLILIGALLILYGFFSNNSATNGDINIKIVKTNKIMPAAHNVYSNENVLYGMHYLFKAKITNNTDAKLEGLSVSYEIPGLIEWEELEVVGEMLPGQTVSVVCYPKFDQKIAKKTNETVEKTNIKITWKGADEKDEIEESFDFIITNRNEFVYTSLPKEEISGWGDIMSNAPLLACFVTPNDPIVKYYTQNIQEKVLKGETASVTKTPEEAIRLLAGIYQATIQSGMVYSGTKGIPENTTDVSQFSQHNRLPREVITGNTGLCLELSLLYASVLSNVGLEPIIFLVPGHAYPGFRLNGQYYAIEATGIGGEGIGNISSVDKAIEAGMKQLGEFINKAQMGTPRYQIIDIRKLHDEGVIPMNLEDDAFLRKKVDDISLSWSNKGKSSNRIAPRTQKQNMVASQNNNTRRTNNISRKRSSSRFAFPNNFQTYKNPVPEVSTLSFQSISPNQQVAISVFDVPLSNKNEALMMIQDELYYAGQSLQYQSNGRDIYGSTYAEGTNFVWIGKSKKTNRGYRFITVGALDYNYSNNSSTIDNIYNSIP